MDNLPKRKHPRLNDFDYSSSGAYFITICTYNRQCLLSHIVGRGFTPAENALTEYGKIAEKQLLLLEERYPCVQIGEYVIMPNHIHFILILDNETPAVEQGQKRREQALALRMNNPTHTVGQGFTPAATSRPAVTDVICAYKSLTTRECKKARQIDKLFQTSFYEHIIRNQQDYDEIANYISENPSRWIYDKLYNS